MADGNASDPRAVSAVTRLVLWDVDGTLLHPGPGVVEAYEQAVAETLDHGRAGARCSMRPPAGNGPLVDKRMSVELTVGGMTDPQVCLLLLRRAGLTPREADRLLPDVLRGVEERVAASVAIMREEGRVMPGVPDVLSALYEASGVLQSVVTGNTVANARAKLSAFGLGRWLDLDVGAFGSDDHDRRALVGVALARAGRRRGLTFAGDQVWVVGDTPRDLACARAGGVRCALVGTGHHTLEELGALGPDLLLPDLGQVDRVVAVLTR